MNNILLLITISISSLIFACKDTSQAEGNYINISGTVSYPLQGIIILERYIGLQPVPIDTFTLDENYSFNQKVKIDYPGYHRFNFYNKQFVNVLLNDEDINIKVDGNKKRGFQEITGSSDHDFIKKIYGMRTAFESSKEVQDINNKFTQARANDNPEFVKEAMDTYNQLHQDFLNEVVRAIDSVGATLGSIEILKSSQILNKDENFNLYLKIAEKAKQNLKNSPSAMEFINSVEKNKKLAIGQLAPKIELPNPNGEIIPLSSLKGKYVLVDFWAKWCRPCRAENPNIVKMYNKYKDKGFEVYGVSLDRNKNDWLQAIQEDKLFWTQVSDLKYWKSDAAITYDIKGIPFAVLLDPEGRIIAKNLRGKALEEKLFSIFGE